VGFHISPSLIWLKKASWENWGGKREHVLRNSSFLYGGPYLVKKITLNPEEEGHVGGGGGLGSRTVLFKVAFSKEKEISILYSNFQKRRGVQKFVGSENW